MLFEDNEYDENLFEDLDNFFPIVDKLQDLYVSYRGRYVEAAKWGMRIPKQKGGEYKKLDNKAIANHLNERYAVCVYAGEWSSRFVCFDVDLPDRDLVRRLIDSIEEYGVPRDRIYISTSGGKGYHVEIFFDSLMYTSDLKTFYNYICQVYHFDKKKVEFRPTRGQAIKLPLSRHAKTGNICWYLDRETLEPIKRKVYILEIEQMSAETMRRLIYTHLDFDEEEEEEEPEDKVEARHIETVEFEDEYPDLKCAGMTHRTIVSIAVRERYKNTPQEKIEERLLTWLARQNPDYITDPVGKMKEDIAAAAAWVYSDKFHLAEGKGRTIKMTAAELNVCLSLKKCARKLMFLVYCGQKRFGSYNVSARLASEIIGCTSRSIDNARKELESLGYIKVKRNKAKYKAGSFVARPNSYYVADNLPKAEMLFTPLVNEIEINEVISSDTFRAVWGRVINTMVAKEDQVKIFTAKELEEVRNG